MSKPNLLRVTYYDPKAEVRLTNYADTLVCDPDGNTLAAIRFGGYPESVKAMADAIYGGCGLDVEHSGGTQRVFSLTKQYRRQITHDGLYAEATLLVGDDPLAAANAEQTELGQPRRTFIFCEQNNPKALFDELDRKTSVPLIPRFQEYFLSELQKRKLLKPLRVVSLRERFDAWVLTGTQDDKPLIQVIDDGLKQGCIAIPGATDSTAFDGVSTVSQYLNAFGVTVAERIKSLFVPLFDPAVEPLSPEVLAVNAYLKTQAGYSLYDAQLAVAEAHKRRLDQAAVTLTIAECGSGNRRLRPRCSTKPLNEWMLSTTRYWAVHTSRCPQLPTCKRGDWSARLTADYRDSV